MQTDDRSEKRVKKLFSELEQIANAAEVDLPVEKATQPPGTNEACESASLNLDALAARIHELEAELEGATRRAEVAETMLAMKAVDAKTSTTPVMVYEKEKVGYAYRDEHVLPIHDAQRSGGGSGQMVVNAPLTAGGEIIGDIEIEPPHDRSWTEDEKQIANSVAQQVSLQIQNLRLLAAAERARTEAEEATHQFTHKSWDNFLDAIHNAERIGYMYDQRAVEPFLESAPPEYDHAEIMETLDEQIGRVFVKGNGSLTEEDRKFIQSIARQVSQQVENIRLLADASRARAEAEEATRRLTRHNWEAYRQGEEDTLGYVYAEHEVTPMGDAPILKSVDFTLPLVVRGENIGQLAVSGGKNVSPEEAELAAAIATQTSIHLETLRLTEELQKRAQELRELDRLKSAFLANMSHELRTPLNSILGFADVMLEELDGPLTPNMNTDLKLIQKNGQHLLHLINDVLDMAKIESGKMNLIVEKFNLHEILQEVTSITSSLASDKKLALVIEADSDDRVEVDADKIRIRQVMINLVNNAIKFTEQGRVSVRAVREKGNVLITVKDTGIGIPPDHVEGIFQEFTQVDSSTTRKAGGTGLGLPISRRLIEMHGGRLWAESTGVEGEGSTFHVLLPIEAKIAEPEPVARK